MYVKQICVFVSTYHDFTVAIVYPRNNEGKTLIEMEPLILEDLAKISKKNNVSLLLIAFIEGAKITHTIIADKIRVYHENQCHGSAIYY